MRHFRDSFEISHHHHRVRWSFYEHHAGIRSDGGLYSTDISSIDEVKLNAVIREDAVEETKSSSVGVVRNNHMLIRFYQPEGCINRSHTRSEGVTESRTFKRGQISLKGQPGRI